MEEVKELVGYIARALVDDPDEVHVDAIEEDRRVVLKLIVSPSDLGKVIGRDGRTARAVRTLLSSSSARIGKRVILDIVEDDDD